MEAFSLQNIVQGSGVAISVTGMAIVFSGLIIMSFFIRLLPVILRMLDKKDAVPEVKGEAPVAVSGRVEAPSEAPSEAPVDTDGEKDIASLIGLILHLENERYYQSDNQYITMNRNTGHEAKWGRAGQLRSTPHRRDYAKV